MIQKLLGYVLALGLVVYIAYDIAMALDHSTPWVCKSGPIAENGRCVKGERSKWSLPAN